MVRTTEQQQPEGFRQYGFHIWPEHQPSTGNTGLTSQGCLGPYAQMGTVGSKRDHFPLARPVHQEPCTLLTSPSDTSKVRSFALVGRGRVHWASQSLGLLPSYHQMILARAPSPQPGSCSSHREGSRACIGHRALLTKTDFELASQSSISVVLLPAG